MAVTRSGRFFYYMPIACLGKGLKRVPEFGEEFLLQAIQESGISSRADCFAILNEIAQCSVFIGSVCETLNRNSERIPGHLSIERLSAASTKMELSAIASAKAEARQSEGGSLVPDTDVVQVLARGFKLVDR